MMENQNFRRLNAKQDFSIFLETHTAYEENIL